MRIPKIFALLLSLFLILLADFRAWERKSNGWMLGNAWFKEQGGYAVCDEKSGFSLRRRKTERAKEMGTNAARLLDENSWERMSIRQSCVRARARTKDDRGGEEYRSDKKKERKREKKRRRRRRLFCSLLIPRHSFARSNLPARRQFNLQPNTLLCLTWSAPTFNYMLDLTSYV